ncbi:hypothetical protein EJ110_NYTH21361 [Nymphaea thermarum]|nr:hypothetical protein EJ110_NYTH21361 [Nymphaea thermarum]
MVKKKQVVAETPEVEEESSTPKEQRSTELEVQAVERMVHIENEEANQRSTHGPPPLPPPGLDKGKGVLGGPPHADPTPLHLQAGPSRPPPTWNNDSNGGNNGHYGGYYGNNGRPSGHQGGHNSYHGGQQSTLPDLEVREPYGPQASQFGKSAYVDYDIELCNLKQTSSVQEYQAHFDNLASMVKWTPKSLITAFIGGLKEEIQIDIRAERNEILRKCFAKARAIEDRQRKKQAFYKPWRNVQAVRPREVPQQKLLPAPPKREEPKPVYRARVPPRMTREERELMIKNKKCFWCKEDWNSSHQCKHIRVYTVLEQSSHRGRGKAALHSVQTQPSQDDPSPGQEGGVGGVEQHELGVEAEGGAGGNATTLKKTLEDQGGGSSPVPIESSLVLKEDRLAHPCVSWNRRALPQPSPVTSGRRGRRGRRCTLSGDPPARFPAGHHIIRRSSEELIGDSGKAPLHPGDPMERLHPPASFYILGAFLSNPAPFSSVAEIARVWNLTSRPWVLFRPASLGRYSLLTL